MYRCFREHLWRYHDHLPLYRVTANSPFWWNMFKAKGWKISFICSNQVLKNNFIRKFLIDQCAQIINFFSRHFFIFSILVSSLKLAITGINWQIFVPDKTSGKFFEKSETIHKGNELIYFAFKTELKLMLDKTSCTLRIAFTERLSFL